MKKTALCGLLCLLLGCSDRSSLKPEKALLGHWATSDGKRECYFTSGERVLIVDGDKRGPYIYTVKAIDDTARKISITLAEPSLVQTFTFSPDKREMVEDANTYAGFAVSEARRWGYVDTKERP